MMHALRTLALVAAAVAASPIVVDEILRLSVGHAEAALLFPKQAPQADVKVAARSSNEHVAWTHAVLTIAKGSENGAFVPVYAAKPGSAVVEYQLTSDDAAFNDLTLSTRIEVLKNDALVSWVDILGWVCFSLWAASFYPQLLENFRRKSVAGLNFDSVVLNLTGFLAYSLFNVGMYFSPTVQSQYQAHHPNAPNPVTLSDVFFAVHASLLTAAVLVQLAVYERGDEHVTRGCWLATGGIWTGALMGLVLVCATDYLSSLAYLQLFSYVKLTLTVLRYIPQVVHNCRRRSTEGFSVGTQLFDIVGGVASVLQMVLQAYNVDDWSGFIGDFTKFGLAAVSIGFDAALIWQHYVLYPHGKMATTASVGSNLSDYEARTSRLLAERVEKKGYQAV